MKFVKIESADTGISFNIEIDDLLTEINIMMLKSQINQLNGVELEDQILLYKDGDQYKRLDSQLIIGIDELTVSGQRIFLFNRRIFTDDTYHPVDVKLVPYEVSIPNISIETTSEFSQKLLESSINSPLLKALPDYESQYKRNLEKGEVFHLATEQCFQSCRKAVEGYHSQLDARNACLSNLNDHFDVIDGEFNSTLEKCKKQQQQHLKILDTFEEELLKLASLPLHPSLVDAFINNDSPTSSLSGLNLDPNKGNTLLDCLPIDREREWYIQCQNCYLKVEENLSQLKIIFDGIFTALKQIEKVTITDDDSNNDDSMLMNIIQCMEQKLMQQDCISELRDDYQICSHKLTSFFYEDCSNNESDVVVLLRDLELRRRAQEMNLCKMEQRCSESMSSKRVIELSKSRMNSKLFTFMKSLSQLQSEMQQFKRKIKLLKKYVGGSNEYFNHLKQVIDLPQAYEQLLLEILRRTEFNNFFNSEVTRDSTRIAGIRAEETKKREQFMRCAGNLPPIFFDMIPSLRSKPRDFTCSFNTESQWLPNIKAEDTNQINKNSESIVVGVHNDNNGRLENQNVMLMNKNAELTKKIALLEANVSPIITKLESSTVESILGGYSLIENILSSDNVDDDNLEEAQLMQEYPIIKKAIATARQTKKYLNDKEDISIESDEKHNNKISYCSFDIDDVVLFVPANSSCEHYVAFHENCPYRFLSEESLSPILRDVSKPPDYILGKIIFIDTRISSDNYNPHNLELGTEYHDFTIQRCNL